MKRVFALAILLLAGPLLAEDHTAVRRAVAEGQLRPLSEIIETVQARYPGRIVDVDLEKVRGGYVYEIEILTTDRGRIEVHVDGSSGELIESGPPLKTHIRPLPELLRTLQARHGGHVVDVELEHGSYQVELVQEDGRRIHLLVDPASGETTLGDAQGMHLDQLRPMADVIEAVLERYPGTLLEAELERADDGHYYYELEIEESRGREWVLRVDAISGELLHEDWD